MHRSLPCLLLSLSLLLVACTPHTSTDAPTPASNTAPPQGATAEQAAVDALFAERVQQGEPGAAVGVYRDGQLVLSRAYGMADMDLAVPNTVDTVFNLASVSKQFTAFAIALLEEEGKLRPQDDIRRYLPGLPELETPVTVADLVHHTSGLRDYMALSALSGHDNDSLVRQGHIVQMLERQRGVDFVAGTAYSYSNTGYVLMAEVVEAASGMPFETFMDQRVFQPLGMSHTRVRHDLADLQPGYATGYVPNEDGEGWRRAVYNRIALGPGNVLSTVGDLAKWAGNFAKPVVGDAALIERLSAPAQLRDGTPVNYGYGLIRETIAGHAAVTHSGGISGFNTNFAYFPEQDLAVIVLANRPFPAGDVTAQVAQVYLQAGEAVAPAIADMQGQRAPAQAIPGLAGSYATEAGPVLTLTAVQDGYTLHSLGREPQPLRFWPDGSFGTDEYAGLRYRAVAGPDGRVSALETAAPPANINSNRQTERLARTVPAQTPPAALQALAGHYRSDEIDTTYQVSVESGRVVLRSLWLDGAQPMVETAPGRFEAESGPLQGLRFTVESAGGGKPTALVFRLGRIGALRLARTNG